MNLLDRLNANTDKFSERGFGFKKSNNPGSNFADNDNKVTRVRTQRGHSLILHALFGWIFFYILSIYYLLSPDHYYHL